MTQFLDLVSGAVRATLATWPKEEKPLDEVIAGIAGTISGARSYYACGKVLAVGNGGSAAITAHLAVDLTKCGVRAMTFTDAPTLTALANDHGYGEALARQVAIHAEHNDLLVAVSSSGRSENILAAARAARSVGATVLTFTGFSSLNPLRSLGDVNFWTPSYSYSVVEVAHQLIVHDITDRVGAELKRRKEEAA